MGFLKWHEDDGYTTNINDCAWCGYDSMLLYVGGKECQVTCQDCGIRGPVAGEPKEAIRLWESFTGPAATRSTRRTEMATRKQYLEAALINTLKEEVEELSNQAGKTQEDAEVMLSLLEDWCPTCWLDSPQYAEWREKYGEGE